MEIINTNFNLLYLFSEIIIVLSFSVEDMIKEVDVDGDGRIDFYGKITVDIFISSL